MLGELRVAARRVGVPFMCLCRCALSELWLGSGLWVVALRWGSRRGLSEFRLGAGHKLWLKKGAGGIISWHGTVDAGGFLQMGRVLLQRKACGDRVRCGGGRGSIKVHQMEKDARS